MCDKTVLSPRGISDVKHSYSCVLVKRTMFHNSRFPLYFTWSHIESKLENRRCPFDQNQSETVA